MRSSIFVDWGKPDWAKRIACYMRNRASFAGVSLAVVLAASNCGCGGGSVPPPPVISVSLSQAAFTVPPQATTNFTATVSNDPSGKGVTWSMTCNGATCGSVSPVATASGASTTYTAPGPPGVTLMVDLTATSVADATKSASVAITVPTALVPIGVSVSPPSVTVASGGMQPFTATVTNDPNNAGVGWSTQARLICNGVSILGTGRCLNPGQVPSLFLSCTTCGTFSPASTASGASTTYAAPAHLTPPSMDGYYFTGFLAIVATSVTNTSDSARAFPVPVLAISVSASPTSSSVALKETQQFTAAVTNDATNSGVSWTLTQGGVSCAPDCGTVNPTTTASGVATVYTAPAATPVSPLVKVIATSVEDPTKSAVANVTLTNSSGAAACSIGSGGESFLKGQYAFELTPGKPSVVGSFTADGTGKITGGEEDLFFTNGIDTAASAYAVGPDHRGCLVLTSSGSTSAGGGIALSFSFALGPLNSSGIATAGRISDTTGQRTAAGVIRLQDPTSFVADQFKGSYAMGLVGYDMLKGDGRVAMAGTFSADGVSAISSGTLDIDDAGTITSDSTSTPEGTFVCCDPNGRGSLTLQIPGNPGIGFYMVNRGDLFLVSSTTSPTFQPIGGAGEAVAIPSGTTFTQASLNGNSVLRETAKSPAGPVVDIATVSADGNATMTTSDNINNSGMFNSSSTALNYTVASNGRVTLTGGAAPPVLYLYGPNQGFLAGTDANVTFGILEPQAAGPFSNASFSGAYVLGTENPSASTVTTESGVLNADGKRNASGTLDQSSPTGLTQNQSLNFTDSFPANGVGNVGTGTTAIMISGNKLVFINNTNTNPTITVVEK